MSSEGGRSSRAPIEVYRPPAARLSSGVGTSQSDKPTVPLSRVDTPPETQKKQSRRSRKRDPNKPTACRDDSAEVGLSASKGKSTAPGPPPSDRPGPADECTGDASSGGGARKKEAKKRAEAGRSRQHSGEGRAGGSSVEALQQPGGAERDPAQQVSSLAADFKDLIRLEDVKSRVEEQVVNQLARASLMSILLKQHTAEQANGRDTTSPARVERDPAVASSVSSASQRHLSSRGKKEAHRTPEPQRQQGERQQSSRPPLKKAASSSTLDARPSSSSSSSSSARAEPGADDGLTELERKEARFGSMFKKVLVRWDTQPDVAVLQKMWPDLSRARAALADLYIAAASERSSSAGGGRSSECGKLWLLFYKELDFLQSKGRGRPEMAGRLESVIEEAEAALTRGLEQVQAWAVGADAAAIYTCMGDLARYKARLGGEEQQVEACWKAAERWYHEALAVLPSCGKSYNQLAICELRRHDHLGAAMEYLRGLTAAEPFAARENLISLLEKVRRKALEGKKTAAVGSQQSGPDLLRLGVGELEEGMVNHLLASVLMATTRTDLDKMGTEVDSFVRHTMVLGQRTLRAGLADEAALQRYRRLLRQSTMVVLCSAWTIRERLSGSKEGEAGSMPAELSASLSLVWGLGSVLGGELEVARGWEEARGGPLVVLLEWLLANDWAWRTTGSPAIDPRAVSLVKGVRRLLVSAPLSSGWAENKRVGVEEDGLVRGLRGFLGDDPPLSPKDHDKTEAAAQVARCRLAMRALEVMGLSPRSSSPPPAPPSSSSSKPPPPPVPPSPPARPSTAPASPAALPMPSSAALSMERLCPTCSNTVEAGEATCEFCGYVWEEPAIQDPLPPTAASPVRKGGGMLVGVNLATINKRSGSDGAAGGGREDAWLRGFADKPQASQPRPSSSSAAIVRQAQAPKQELVVIDAPNVAMRHGLNKKFSCRGIALAMDYYRAAGHRVVAFLPDYYLSYERVGELRRAQKADVGGVRAAQLPDDIGLLQALVEARLVIGTPPQDYDDSYAIRYAQRAGGYVVTNDLYRDHLAKIEDRGRRDETKRWLKSHCISYTFVGEEFLPNPDFRFGGGDG